MRVIHYQRRSRPNANYSIESIFVDVRNRLADRCDIELATAPVHSNGILNRMRILRHIGQFRSRNVHVTGDINFAILGLPRRKGILTLHDCGFLYRTQGIRRLVLKHLWVSWPVGWARRVTAVSETAKQDIIKWSKCPQDKITVIPNAISESFRPGTRLFAPNSIRILHVGTAENKNLLRHTAALEGIPDVTLVIVGKLSPSVERHLVSHNISYENHYGLDHKQVVEMYQSCDLLLFASTIEGFGMPILEAQATRIPVITSNISSMPEVARDSALLVDPYSVEEIREAVQKILTDRELRETLIQRGVANHSRFNPQQIAEMYLQLYEREWR